MRNYFPLIFFILALAMPGSAADEFTQEHIQSFSIDAPEGLVLSGLNAGNLDPNSNSSFIFNAYGDVYKLDINSSKSWGWWNFDITLQSPNGSIETKHLRTLHPTSTNYDLHVQYFFMETDTAFDVDVYTGLIPLTASFTNLASASSEWADILPDDYLYTRLRFSNIAGSSNCFFDLTVYASTEEEFQQQEAEDISLLINYGIDEVLSWAWDGVLSFVELIPGVGPYLSITLTMAAMTLSSISFYFNLFFIEYAETTFCTVEFFVWSYALTGFKRGGIFGFLKKLANTHIQIIDFGFKIVSGSISIIFRIFEGIATIVNALKPI
ncbi:hypothetical protein ACSAZL_12460 [Methanosarcina sp. T3]|uniref:hypothetical protein n=1 Tax=Methanosarcina sp. T3 TaxID=3439062 RepID=UPI003F85E6B9